VGEKRVWPINAQEMEPHYRSAIQYCSLGDVAPSDYDNPQAWINRTETPIAYAPQKTGAVRTGVFTVMNGDSGDHYDGALDFQLVWGKHFVQPTNIKVVRNANVRYLESSADRVTIAHAQTIKRAAGKPAEPGLRFRVNAKTYVVAAGGIETVRLLFLSKPGGLGNAAGHLGRNFMIHPLNENAGWVKLNDFPDRGKIRNLYTGWPKIKSNSIYAPRIFAAFVPTDAALKGKTEPIGNYRMLVNFDSGGMNLNWEQTPNPESQITLGTKQDPIFKDPEVTLDFHMTGIEERTAHAAINAVVDELVALGYASDGPRETPQMDWPGDHHMGATRMSAGRKDGYVDPNCKSWEIQNLYIAAPSVFSTGGVSNPTLTIIALASRLADHLARL
jgi:choline dehydrogenase-like flavoprotein